MDQNERANAEGGQVAVGAAGAAWPPAGWVTAEGAAGMLGVSIETLNSGDWRWRGALRAAGRCELRPDGRRPLIFPVEAVERVREARAAEAAERAARRAAPFPPAGYVDRHGAAALLGIGASTLIVWVREKRLGYEGELAKGPDGVDCRVYAVAELERARAEMAAQEAAEAEAPAGFVDFEGAAAFFGVHPGTVTNWQREGRLGGGTWQKTTGRQRRKVFAVTELERVREAMAAEAARPVAPEGFVELHEAARMLGISTITMYLWERDGRLPEGRVTPIPGTSARTKVYPVGEIERVRGEIAAAVADFPPAGWLTMGQAAKRAGVSLDVWKRWIADGRVESGRWVSRPTKARSKVYSAAEVDRLVEEEGRDHLFFLEEDGAGGHRVPAGFVGRAGAAAMFGVSERTIVTWQTEGRITCGRWARTPVGGGIGRRVYPVEELGRLLAEFQKAGRPYVDPADPAVVRVPIMSWSATRFEAVIDAGDLPLIEGMRWNWGGRSDGEDAVVVRSAPSGEQVPLRRVILGLSGFDWKISHRNGDPLDCRRGNLVVRDASETLAHSRKRRTTHGGRACTSRFKGVCWIERLKRWSARVQRDGVARRLGLFRDEIAAAVAYDAAARELFGEHAMPNFPDGVEAWLAGEGGEGAAGRARAA